MTKQQLQKELKEKLKLGVKPSHLKKSKSTSDLPAKNIQTTEPLRRNRIDPLISQESLTKQLQKAQDEISILELKLETQARELGEFKEENSHLKEQVKEKQKDLENLRKLLEEIRTELIQVRNDLDKSLAARHQSLKDWNQVHQKIQTLNSELEENIEQSADELINQDKLVIDLRSQIVKLKQTNQNLQKDLNLTSKLAQMRKIPYYSNEFNSLDYLKYFAYSVIAVGFILVLMRRKEADNG